MRADHYDGFAREYQEANASGLFNTYYERPAMLRLAGDVRGRRILDVGCGTGPLTAELRDRGAEVTGLDGSPAMIELAREHLGDDVPLHVADLAEPLPFADDTFDDVVASLVLHYLEDWAGPLAEIKRVLKPGGRLLLSVNHPVHQVVDRPEADQFAVWPYTEDYDFDGETVWLTFWHRSLRAMSAAFADAGFSISLLDEPEPSPDTPPELLPPRLRSGERSTFFGFLFFVLEAR
ncbi:class I SAM-dependent methyltransferase [Isoptericola sediminis]|nr:class I SAM-dependent methyltransferase [Isoptericola sediminis]